MKKHIIFAVGKDQPGIVAPFTQLLYENRCNLEDSSMTLLEDYFTMLFIVHSPEDLTTAALQERLQTVSQDFQLQLAIFSIETEEENPSPKGRPWMLSVTGPDQIGIMYHVTRYLASQKVNIRQLSSKRLSRLSGEPLFLMALEVEVPESVSDEGFSQGLRAVSGEGSLEIHAEPLEVYRL